MPKTALFIVHYALPGKRDDVKRVWEKYIKPRSIENPDHELYYYCYDNDDPDVIRVFQVYPDKSSQEKFLQGAWYPEYLNEIKPLVSRPPEINYATPEWVKPT